MPILYIQINRHVVLESIELLSLQKSSANIFEKLTNSNKKLF